MSIMPGMMPHPTLQQLVTSIIVLTVAIQFLCAETIYVAVNGQDTNTGTQDSPLATLQKAIDRAAPGDVVRIGPGTCSSASTVKISRSGEQSRPIRLEPADEHKRPILDFSAQKFGGGNNGLDVTGDWWQIVGLEIVKAGHNGIRVAGSHNLIERCVVHECQDTGINLSPPASENLILDCDSYRNIDIPTRGENADGFGAKHAIGPGNVFRGCRAWENCDDGFDLWMAPQPVRIENCVAIRNGINFWKIANYAGDGNGFKLGGNFVAAKHVVVNCVAIDQPHRGFDQNNNTAGLTVENCTAIRCEFGFYFPAAPKEGGPHVLKKNVSFDSPARIAQGSVEEDNRWLRIEPPATAPSE
jgi:hypothetical protein